MYCQIEPIKMEQKARLPHRNAGNLKALNQIKQKKNSQLKIEKAEPKKR